MKKDLSTQYGFEAHVVKGKTTVSITCNVYGEVLHAHGYVESDGGYEIVKRRFLQEAMEKYCLTNSNIEFQIINI